MPIALSVLLRRKNTKIEAKYRQDLMVRQYGEQFKKLLDKGIELPVVLL